MQLRVLCSDSSGNCYQLIDDNGCSIIIELGVNIQKIKEFINFDISKVRGCLCSHLHVDHSQAVPDALELGLRVYSNKTVCGKYKGCKLLPKDGHPIGLFYVIPVKLFHDTECTGWIISHPEMGRLFFGIDSGKIPYLFNDISHFLIEANFDDDSMTDSIIAGKFVQRERLLENHLSFDRAIDFLKRNINAKTRNIVFLHLSKNNTNYHKILSESKRLLSFENIFIAEKGLEININKDLF